MYFRPALEVPRTLFLLGFCAFYHHDDEDRAHPEAASFGPALQIPGGSVLGDGVVSVCMWISTRQIDT